MTYRDHEHIERIHVLPDDIRNSDVAEWSASYDEVVDTLFLYFTNEDIAPVAVLVDADHDIYALVDPEAMDVVGMQFEGYLEHLVHVWPEFLSFALIAGIPASRLESTLDEIAATRSQPATRNSLFNESPKARLIQILENPETKPSAAIA